MRPALPRSLRARLLLTVFIGLALALIGATAGFNLLLRRSLSGDATRLAQERAAARSGTLELANGRLGLPDTPDESALEGQVWVFAGTRAIEDPPATAELRQAVARLATGPPRTANGDENVRLASVPVLRGGRRIGTVVAGVSLAPYEHTEREALIASLALSAALLAVVMGAAVWVLRSALRPVSRMTADAAAWSERDLDRRFNVGEPYDEVSRLARTLDGLLDRIAASLRHERRFSAELSHELRTPLAKITAEAELALRRERDPAGYREALAAVLRSARQLTRTVDTLVAAARQDATNGGGRSDARAAVWRAVEGCGATAAEAGLALEVDAPGAPVRVGVDADIVERILQPIIENACRYGRTRVDVGVARVDGHVEVSVRDDGPGVSDEERDRIFEPGVRGSAGHGDAERGAGLGLALSRRLARAAGGEVLATGEGGGGSFAIRLPRA